MTSVALPPTAASQRLLTAGLLPLALLLALIPGAAAAGVGSWTTHGPEGGATRVIAFDPSTPSTIYVGTFGGGVFKSTNSGASWAPVNAGITNGYITALAVDPFAHTTVYAGTLTSGVFKSIDGGVSWAAVNSGLAVLIVESITMHPSSPGTVYATTQSPGGGVWKSINGAASWTYVSAAIPDNEVFSLEIDPTSPATLYAGTSNGVFRSRDAGGTWNPTTNGLPAELHVQALAVALSAPATVYAGAYPGGVYKTTNSGDTWSAVNSGLFGQNVQDLEIDPLSTNTVYAATSDGVFKSTNGGASWVAMNAGLSNTSVFDLAFDPTSSSTLLAATDGGLFRSTNGGAAWSSLNTGLTGTDVRALVIDPSAPAIVYAGTAGAGVFRSTDAAGSWTAIDSGLRSPLVYGLAIDPTAPSTIYAASLPGASGASGGGLFKTTNAGASWTALGAGLTTSAFLSLAIDPASPATIYAGASGPASTSGVFKSTDGGAHWTRTSVGLGGISVNALAVDPTAPANVYAGLFGGVWKSSDAGASWTAMSAGLTNTTVLAIAIDPSAPGTVYAATNGGVFKSVNGGGSWTAVSAGLANGSVAALAIDRSSPATLYAGTNGGGIFRSTNAGATWVPFNTGLTVPFVRSLAIDPSSPTKLYAGTGGGVFEYRIADTSPCVAGVTTLCLNGGRFRVTTRWATRTGATGSGQAVALTGDTGYFTFFAASNVEMLVKVLNGCVVNSHYWVFAGGLTDVQVEMTVTDTQTGAVKTYANPQGTPFQPIQDTSAFESCGGPAASPDAASEAETAAVAAAEWGRFHPPATTRSTLDTRLGPGCADATHMCLNGRYRVQAQWRTRAGATGEGRVIDLTPDTGAFWFFSPNNVEMVVKVLNGCGVNSRYWVFAGGLTDVEVTLTVTDAHTATVKTYTNPQGMPFQPIQDTSTFATCP